MKAERPTTRTPATAQKGESAFRRLCHERGLSATRQREVIYDVLMSSHEHPSPEELYARVHAVAPSISLATVYKTLHSFVEAGIVQQMNPHRGTLRVDVNDEPHHHLVCTSCHSITDIDADAIAPVSISSKLPAGFVVERCSVEIHGLCRRCAEAHGKSASS